MVRRWSRLNQQNLFSFSFNKVHSRFKVLQLRKAINFRKFIINITKFKRRKLSSWKRKQNWLIYTQILKYWIRDYVFTKKIAKSQFVESGYKFNVFVHDFNFIKKKNPLIDPSVYGGVLNFLPKIFFFYYKNKFNTNSLDRSFVFFKSSNFVLFNFFNLKNISENQSLVSAFFKYEFNFFNFNEQTLLVDDNSFPYLNNFNFLIKNTFLFNLQSYKIFLFFLFFKR
jgi:hypothetical protein